MNLSPHFTLAELTVSETAARYGLDNRPPTDALDRLRKLCALLEEIRLRLGVPIIITSGYRSPAVNAMVRGAKESQHMRGEAADFIAPQFGPPSAVCSALRNSGIAFDQLILEFAKSGRGWTHVSVADKPRRMALEIDEGGTRPMFA